MALFYQLISGHKGQLAPNAVPWVLMINKFYRGSKRLSTSLGSTWV